MKAVMASIRPQYCAEIATLRKRVEVRKTKPNLPTPFKIYIYCTLSGCNEFFRDYLHGDLARWNREKWADKKGRVIGEFVCDGYDVFCPSEKGIAFKRFTALAEARLTVEELRKYAGRKPVFGWRISQLVIYDKPRELSEFRHEEEIGDGMRGLFALRRPPQSWCYVEDVAS